MVRKYFLSLILFLSTAADVVAQVLVARPFPFTRQLFTNEVYDVYQDRDGYMWFGTTAGLERWDGYRLRSFRSTAEYPDRLADNHIRILADTPDLLWIATDKGLTLLNKTDGRSYKPKDERLKGLRISGMQADASGGMWLAIGHRLFHCNSTCSEVKEINPFINIEQEQDVFDIYLDRENTLWVMCRNGVLLRSRVDGFEQLPALPNGGTVCTMFQDREHHYWMGTWGAGLWQFKPDADNSQDCWVEHSIVNHHLNTPESIIFCIRQDKAKGWLWMLSYDELHAMKYEEGKLVPIDLSTSIDPFRYYTKMNVDREGNLWVSANDEGYTISFDLTGTQNHHLPQLVSQQQGELNLISLYADGPMVWLNQSRKGLQLLNRTTGRIVNQHHPGRPELSTLRPGRQEGSVWATGRYEAKIAHLVRQGEKVTTDRMIDVGTMMPGSGLVSDMYEDTNHTLWMLTRRNLLAWVPAAGGQLLKADLEHPYAMTPLHDHGEILCATDSALVRCTLNGNTIQDRKVASLGFLANNERVRSMCVDATGRLWAATDMGRIFRSNSQLQDFKLSPLDSLLSDGLVQDMLVSGHTLWMMNDKRLVRYHTDTHAAETFTAHQGIVEVQAFQHHALCNDGNGILAGGYGGFIHLSNESLVTSADAITPTLTDVLVGNKSLLFDTQDNNGSNSRHFILAPDAQRISLLLSTLMFFPSHAPHIQYRLEGVDGEWTDTDDAHPAAFYSHLPRGQHRLWLRVRLSDGSWSVPVDAATIERLPHWYETIWAFAIYLIIIGVLIAVLIWRVRKRYAKKLQAGVAQAKVAIITSDHHLTDEIVKIIDKHLDDSDFGLTQLLEEMNVSKTTLYRQLKTETDMSPSDLIRSIRMKRACEMLLARKMNISEVAYATGFSTPKYFTRCFKDTFGQTPTDYIQSHSSD
jgi:ligand-binding sensor domain-containing protein/AraC-like DNA-binding protein